MAGNNMRDKITILQPAREGGSYIKGTDTQTWSNVDVVLFSDSFSSISNCKKKKTHILESLEKQLKKSAATDRFQFKCFKNLHIHHFDVMPCCDTLGAMPSRAVKRNLYCRLYNCGDNEEIQLHSISLLQYQVDFVKVSTVGVKDLIRLIKHWLKTSFADFSEENRFRKLPSSYAIELIVIYVWQLAGKPILFSLVQGLRAVLKLLVRYLEVCIVWYEHYDSRFQILKKTIQKQTRPFVLDPVNPTFNVCENSNAWDEVAHVARNSLLKPLLNGVQAKEPWLFTNDW
nr:PREDICTED: 2'-5'-oligoadenylate synthase 3-like isoform X3 [Latimeria chalumnae]|eukprot:XP_014353848.1 PREDICTED: 2'-5'-oligoadenylate synthase 3-like isoform X3 [Latimeria chalumnae]